jgi:hypothetical protein
VSDFSGDSLTETVTKPEFEIAQQKRATVSAARWLIAAGLLVLALWLGLKTWRIAGATQSLLRTQQEIETLVTAPVARGLPGLNLNEAERIALQTRRDVLVLKNELGFLRPIAPRLAALPRIGPLLAASPHLLEMADGGTEAAVYMLSLRPAVEALQAGGPTGLALGPLLGTIVGAQQDLQAAADAMDRAVPRAVVAQAGGSTFAARPGWPTAPADIAGNHGP